MVNRLKLDLVLSETEQNQVVEYARRLRPKSPGWSIQDPVLALMEIFKRVRIFDQCGTKINGAAFNEMAYPWVKQLEGCAAHQIYESVRMQHHIADRVPESRSTRPDLHHDATGEEGDCGEDGKCDLDLRESGLYICRWPDGTFSIVLGETKRYAMLQLDEWADAKSSWLIPLDSLLVDFRLNNSGAIELNEFNAETEEFIRNNCYPELAKVLSVDDVFETARKVSPQRKRRIRAAVAFERSRLMENGSKEHEAARTEGGKRLQKEMPMAGPVADYYIERAGKELLESDVGEDSEPN